MASPKPVRWVVLCYVLLFLGGGVLGLGLARQLAPGSFGAEAAGLFMLPVGFALGLQLWFGVALLSVLGMLLLGRPRPGASRPIPGGFVFVPVSSVSGALFGMAGGLLAGRFLAVFFTFWLVGTLYGVLAWRLAVAGYLMPPEEL